MGRTFMLMPTTPKATREHLRDDHGYPHYLLDALSPQGMTDWEVVEDHIWEHENADRHSDPSHTHDDGEF